MAWYVKESGKEVGPVNKTQLQALIKAKKINANTLVRKEDSEKWVPLSELVRPKKKNPTPTPQPPHPAPAAQPEPPQPANVPETTVCSQCGRSFPEDQVVRFDDQIICAACKPLFVQKLREGADMATTLRYAGFWIRFAAYFIDGIIMGILQYAILIPLNMLLFSSVTQNLNQTQDMSAFMGMAAFQGLVSLLIPVIYYTFFVGRFSATLGKMACRIKIVTPSGGRVSYPRALGRFFAQILSSIILCIGFLMAAFDNEKRALHDRICATRVVYK